MNNSIIVQDCVGCGFCCRKGPCGLAQRIYACGEWTGCPGLVFHDDRWWCKPIEEARGTLRDDLIKELYIGDGCCCSMNTDRANIPRPPEENVEDIDWRKAFQELSAVLGRQMISGDLIHFVASGLEEKCGMEVANKFLHWVRGQRDSFTEDFMG